MPLFFLCSFLQIFLSLPCHVWTEPRSLLSDRLLPPSLGVEGSSSTRRIDPLADLREATEKNAREAREEKERAEQAKADAAKAAQEEADAAAKDQVDAAAKAREEEATKAQADAAAKAQAGAAAGGQAPQLVIPLRSMPPATGIPAPAGGAGNDQPVMERGGGDPIIVEAEVTPPVPTADAQTNRPKVPQGPPVGGELVVGVIPEGCTLGRRRSEKTAPPPRTLDFGAASSSAPDAEASSAAPPEWTPGGGTSVLNCAANDVQV